MDPREQAYFFLSQVAAISAGRSRRLLLQCDASEIADIPGKELYGYGIETDLNEIAVYERFRNPELLTELYEKTLEKGIRFLSMEHPDYPQEFRFLPDLPAGIYVKGRLPEKTQHRVSVVGSRRCSNYGKECAFFFGRQLAEAGICVVSGLALGVDGYAESGAAGAASAQDFGAGHCFSAAILGGGPDQCYPKENIGLYRRLTEGLGCVISEKPAGYTARAYDFPKRNRLISAYGECLAVVEASERSGTHTTVEYALDYGREVFAVPGRIGERMSLGCNELIKNGAQILTCPEDILQYLGIKVQKDTRKPVKISLTPEEKTVLGLISQDAVSVDEIMEGTGFPVSLVLEILIRLEMKGAVRKNSVSGYVLALT